ncbi:MAG: hypothetical protein LBR66_09650 [Candidatus Symbiothrix sp.]|nr:hypothetical protein [Candidatus Symbiothrix sp.]
MDKKITRLGEINKTNPFKTPEGYFEGLTEQIMSQLPERADATPHVIPLWSKVKTWVYMAAMFSGIALMINLFTHVKDTPQQQQGLNLSSSAELEEYYQYYEQQMTQNIYHEAFYVNLE